MRTVTEKARLKLKQKVLREMRYVCQRRAQINDLHSQFITDHYKRVCIGMLAEWKDLTQKKLERRESLMNR